MKLSAIYLSPEYQGKGVGKKLFQTALNFIGDKTITINVAKYNQKAIGFYEHFGFKYLIDIQDPNGALPSGKVIPEQMMIKLNSCEK